MRRNASIASFSVLAIVTGLLVYPDLQANGLEERASIQSARRILSARIAGEQLPSKLDGIRARNENLFEAFEHLVEASRQGLVEGENLDELQLRRLADAVEAGIAENPTERFAFLGAYALDGAEPLTRAIALITIRECYSRKFSVAFASQCARSDDPFLKRLGAELLQGSYTRSRLSDKVMPAQLRGLGARSS